MGDVMTADTAGSVRRNLNALKATWVEGHISLPPHLDRNRILSKQLGSEEDLFSSAYAAKDESVPAVIEPLYDPEMLYRYQEISGELAKTVDVMIRNVHGFGYDLVPILDPVKDKDKITPEIQAKIDEEWARIKNVFDFGCICDDSPISFTQLRTRMGKAVEGNGYSGWEVLRANGEPNSVPVGFAYVRGYQLRVTALSRPVLCKTHEPRYQPDRSLKMVEVTKHRRFRLYLQKTRSSERWFKEVGDPRTIDNTTGREIKPGQPVDQDRIASELVFFNLFDDVTPYGLPRFVGNMLLIDGDVACEEINHATLENDCVPAIAIGVSGVDAKATEGTENRIKNFQNRPKGQKRNRGSILLLEAESTAEGLEVGASKLQIWKLGDSQARDSMFQNYQEHNSERIRSRYRFHPTYTGKSSNKNEIDAGKRQSEEQVFAPERDDFDDRMNLQVLPLLRAEWHRFKSRGPRVTDDQDLIKILSVAERTGGMNPTLSKEIIGEILNRNLGPVEGIDPKIPASFQVAQIVANLRTNLVSPGGGARSDSKVVQLMKATLLQDLLDVEPAGGGADDVADSAAPLVREERDVRALIRTAVREEYDRRETKNGEAS